MSEENKNIEITFDKDSEIKELIIRNGVAPLIFNPEEYEMQGTIGAPAAWWEHWKDQLDKQTCLLTVDRDKMIVTLQTNPKEPHYQYKIVGKLELDTKLEKFHINNSKIFSREEFIRLLKMNRAAFVKPEECMNLVYKLQELEISVSQDIERKDDDRGNKSAAIRQEVSSAIPEGFTLSLPVFKGGPKSHIPVTIGYDVQNHSVLFWLESIELAETIDNEAEAQINAVVAEFGQDVAIIEV